MEFGRIAAGNGKQVIIQGLREAERGMIYDEFSSKQHEILTGTVSRIDPRSGNVILRIGTGSEATEAVLTTERAGARRGAARGADGQGVSGGGAPLHPRPAGADLPHPPRSGEAAVRAGGARDLRRHRGGHAPSPGRRAAAPRWPCGRTTRTWIPSAPASVPEGQRVNAIVEELRGEKIDIIKYSEDPAEFIAAALAPADVVSVQLAGRGQGLPRDRCPTTSCRLAIGKEGQNARLAARLTGYKIDIKPAPAPEEQRGGVQLRRRRPRTS